MSKISLREKLKNIYFTLIGFIPSIFFIFFSLNLIMKITRSVKPHYIENYNSIFKKIRFNKYNILEIGIGGHDLEHYKGGSLLMWKHYFLFSKIYGLDIIKKNYNIFPRIKSFSGSQTDPSTLNSILSELKRVNIIIDDGSHYLDHIFFTFKYLFNHLSDNGIYIIEDIKMQFVKSVVDTPLDEISDPSLFFNTLIHRINSSKFGEIIDDYYINNIDKIICYDRQIIIYKGERKSKKSINVFPSNKTSEGYIKISEEINKATK